MELVSAGQHQSARRAASACASKKQPAAVCDSYRRPVPASASEPANQPGEPDRKTDRGRATSEPSRQLGRQTAANRIATQLIRQVGSQVAAAASLQQAVFFAALFCSTSPPAKTRLTVYRRSQHTTRRAFSLGSGPAGIQNPDIFEDPAFPFCLIVCLSVACQAAVYSRVCFAVYL